MKNLKPFRLAFLIVTVAALAPNASAGNLSPRLIEENPALVRGEGQAKQSVCNFCALDGNAAYQRSPKTIEANPELARIASCAELISVKARGNAIAAGRAAWPRLAENR